MSNPKKEIEELELSLARLITLRDRHKRGTSARYVYARAVEQQKKELKMLKKKYQIE